ncbi:ABC transporter ATP-binding protein [Pseudoglutamicibacter cumminsii]|uniref:ABC transporter ATP-binding protein n=1 Tax=Pseudoglutamicibacter cumminsii TaxID=156979 RepID=UPI002ABA3BCF|nr:ABC transporter ATP-binding protein [Pseudoglutamicibacter cumminsii]MDZ3745283.1 ABC transporter ATP-binding protein [Pseudoglutamicibacter cumminsii]
MKDQNMNENTQPVTDAPDDRTPLLDVKDLEVTFSTQAGPVHAVRGVSFELFQGENLAIVGESGSGKSTSVTAILGLLASNGSITGGKATFNGIDLTKAPRKQLEDIRGREIGYVPQDPMSNLNPVWNIGFQVQETIEANTSLRGKAARERVIEVLKEAGLPEPEGRLKQYPHQFSGGMRQRVLIGIGMSANPRLLVADEPTSALDVTVQRRILDHLGELTREHGTSVIFITHDLGLAAERAEKLVVMYKGQVVEYGDSKEILANPMHPYTKRLVGAAPSLASRRIQSVQEGDDVAVGADEKLCAATRKPRTSSESMRTRSSNSPTSPRCTRSARRASKPPTSRPWTRSRCRSHGEPRWAWSANRVPVSQRWRRCSSNSRTSPKEP